LTRSDGCIKLSLKKLQIEEGLTICWPKK